MLLDEKFIHVSSISTLEQYPEYLQGFAKLATAEQYADALADYQRKRYDEMSSIMNTLSLIEPEMTAQQVKSILNEAHLDGNEVIEINGGFTLVKAVAQSISEETMIPWWKGTTEDITNWTKSNAEQASVTVDELLESVCDKQMYLQEAYSYLKSLGNTNVASRLTDFSNALASFGRSANTALSKTQSWFTSMLSKVDGLKNGLTSLLEGLRSKFNSVDLTAFEEYTGVNPVGAYIPAVQRPGYWAAVLLTPYGIWEASKFLYKCYDRLMDNVIKPFFKKAFKKVTEASINPYDLLMGADPDAQVPSINQFSVPVFNTTDSLQPEPWILFDSRSDAEAFTKYVQRTWTKSIASMYYKSYNLVYRSCFGEISMTGTCFTTINIVEKIGNNGITYYAVPSRMSFTGSNGNMQAKPYLIDYGYLWSVIAKRFGITVDQQTLAECKASTRFSSCDGIKFTVADDNATVDDLFSLIQDFATNPSFVNTAIASEKAAYGSILCSNTILSLLGPIFFSNQSTYNALSGKLKSQLETLFPWNGSSAPDLSNINQQTIGLKKLIEAIYAGSRFFTNGSLPVSWSPARPDGDVTNAHFLYAASSYQSSITGFTGLGLVSFTYPHNRDSLDNINGIPVLLNIPELLWYSPYLFVIGQYLQDVAGSATTQDSLSTPSYFIPYYSGQSDFKFNSLYTIKTDGQNIAAAGALLATVAATVTATVVGIGLSKAKKSLRLKQADRDAKYRNLGNKLADGTATKADVKAYNKARRNTNLCEKFLNAGSGANIKPKSISSVDNPGSEGETSGSPTLEDIKSIFTLIKGE